MPAGDAESRPLIQSEDPEFVFSRALDVELEKITSFYVLKENELFEEVDSLLKDAEDYEEEEDIRPPTRGSERGHSERPRSVRFRSHSNRSQPSTEDGMEEDSDDEGDEETGLTTKRRRSSLGGRRRTLPNAMGASTDLTASTDFTRRYSMNFDDYAEQAALFSSGIMLKKRMINLSTSSCASSSRTSS